MGNAGHHYYRCWCDHVDATILHVGIHVLFYYHISRHGDVYHRQSFSGITVAQIRINNLRKDFGDFTAVKSSSFTVEDGEFFMLLGPSGCGKTTTLRMIAGLELPTSGEIHIGDKEVSNLPGSKRDIAFVFQMFALYPHMNVRRNLSYPLVSQGMKRSAVKAKVNEVAKILDIESILSSPVGGLSGGDRQRVALGRAIVRDPQAFLMDEPLGALDAEFRERMSEELRALHDRMNATTIYVTHDQLEAMQMGDKIVVMNEGAIEQFGTPQEVHDNPATLFVANFIGSPAMNLLPFRGSVTTGTTDITLGQSKFELPRQLQNAEGDLVFGIRPEHVKLTDHSNFRAQVLASEYLGTTQIVTLDTEYGTTKARISSDQQVQTGDQTGLDFDTNAITLFDQHSGAALAAERDTRESSHG